ncbi:DUF2306 domain-containing protein [Biformimicrobium ophioploci]|uniref:DUF2306 domain-containing protein n=1 Tax=Biformimicrobium ophioploci TaxID=3036711 RepID=A0ABQ6LW67_9GAMM|nr:DUF2306 domain-containing protein [Microbulbifer sp. NKW57]GMG86272.1 DUF2306 domain-containing protein [Microbulbifer sp. NKW57]
MNDAVIYQTLPQKQSRPIDTRRAVDLSVKTWFSIAALGHAIFFFYILAVFYPPIAESGFYGLKGMHLPAGFREGDTLGNLAAVSHVLLAAIVIGGGPLQLIPVVRQRAPRFHRILGRSYLLAAVISSIGGLYMTWTRHSIGNLVSQITITIDGVLILVFAFLAVRTAMGRRLGEHRRWALRLFMAGSAVWFFRVALMGWAMLTGGVGIDWESFTGPFLYALGFGQYLLPLLMLEWYFHCQKRETGSGAQLAFIGTLLPLTVFMAIGIFAATMGMWLPRM